MVHPSIAQVASDRSEQLLFVAVLVNVAWSGWLCSQSILSADRFWDRSSRSRELILPFALTSSFLFTSAAESVTFLLLITTSILVASVGAEDSSIHWWESSFFICLLFQTLTGLLLQLSLVSRLKDFANTLPDLSNFFIWTHQAVHTGINVLFSVAICTQSLVVLRDLFAFSFLPLGVELGLLFSSAISPKAYMYTFNTCINSRQCNRLMKGMYASGFAGNMFLIANAIWFTINPSSIQPLVHIVLSKGYMSALVYLLGISDRSGLTSDSCWCALKYPAINTYQDTSETGSNKRTQVRTFDLSLYGVLEITSRTYRQLYRSFNVINYKPGYLGILQRELDYTVCLAPTNSPEDALIFSGPDQLDLDLR
ncbi:uncharacterized protein FIBRA_03601 [Fibroporia radiculosa]|uniref:Uncharacterized protein n=1 Tax=Fibroporia radiculosa TaxID=599839 RepID=J4GNK4_9APHY|nr:uncharacterized protein FIBRA_03601 [Fibroporia radiculosa]CCM01545.1 predicted protein [Fibroporia radiculosa]